MSRSFHLGVDTFNKIDCNLIGLIWGFSLAGSVCHVKACQKESLGDISQEWLSRLQPSLHVWLGSIIEAFCTSQERGTSARANVCIPFPFSGTAWWMLKLLAYDFVAKALEFVIMNLSLTPFTMKLVVAPSSVGHARWRRPIDSVNCGTSEVHHLFFSHLK